MRRRYASRPSTRGSAAVSSLPFPGTSSEWFPRARRWPCRSCPTPSSTRCSTPSRAGPPRSRLLGPARPPRPRRPASGPPRRARGMGRPARTPRRPTPGVARRSPLRHRRPARGRARRRRRLVPARGVVVERRQRDRHAGADDRAGRAPLRRESGPPRRRRRARRRTSPCTSPARSTRPGVYELDGDARVIDAVEAAGGGVPEADLDRLNLAAKVVDGERVLVQKVGDPAVAAAPGVPAGSGDPGTTGAPAGPVNVNTATQAELENLPGIGPTLAAVDHRRARPPRRVPRRERAAVRPRHRRQAVRRPRAAGDGLTPRVVAGGPLALLGATVVGILLGERAGPAPAVGAARGRAPVRRGGTAACAGSASGSRSRSSRRCSRAWRARSGRSTAPRAQRSRRRSRRGRQSPSAARSQRIPTAGRTGRGSSSASAGFDGGAPVGRTVLLSARGDAAARLRLLEAGDRVTVTGWLEPLSGFDTRAAVAARGRRAARARPDRVRPAGLTRAAASRTCCVTGCCAAAAISRRRSAPSSPASSSATLGRSRPRSRRSSAPPASRTCSRCRAPTWRSCSRSSRPSCAASRCAPSSSAALPCSSCSAR